MLRVIGAKAIKKDFNAREAVLSSISGFLGLDLLRSVESDSNRNDFLLSFAIWFIPGFMAHPWIHGSSQVLCSGQETTKERSPLFRG